MNMQNSEVLSIETDHGVHRGHVFDVVQYHPCRRQRSRDRLIFSEFKVIARRRPCVQIAATVTEKYFLIVDGIGYIPVIQYGTTIKRNACAFILSTYHLCIPPHCNQCPSLPNLCTLNLHSSCSDPCVL